MRSTTRAQVPENPRFAKSLAPRRGRVRPSATQRPSCATPMPPTGFRAYAEQRTLRLRSLSQDFGLSSRWGRAAHLALDARRRAGIAWRSAIGRGRPRRFEREPWPRCELARVMRSVASTVMRSGARTRAIPNVVESRSSDGCRARAPREPLQNFRRPRCLGERVQLRSKLPSRAVSTPAFVAGQSI